MLTTVMHFLTARREGLVFQQNERKSVSKVSATIIYDYD